MRTSETLDKLAAALAAAQGEMEDARKDSLNPHFQSKYADLSAVRKVLRPVLAKHGLAVVQLPQTTDRGVVLETRLLHSSGEWIEGEFLLTVQGNSMQNVVSAITYARRASLAAVTGVAPTEEDDDGEAASGRGDQPRANTRSEPPKSAKSTKAPSPRSAPMSSPSPGPGSEVMAARAARVISAEQVKRLWTLARKRNWADADIKALILRFGFESSKDITVEKYDDVVASVESGEVPPVQAADTQDHSVAAPREAPEA